MWLFHMNRRKRSRNSQQTVALRVHLNTLCSCSIWLRQTVRNTKQEYVLLFLNKICLDDYLLKWLGFISFASIKTCWSEKCKGKGGSWEGTVTIKSWCMCVCCDGLPLSLCPPPPSFFLFFFFLLFFFFSVFYFLSLFFPLSPLLRTGLRWASTGPSKKAEKGVWAPD